MNKKAKSITQPIHKKHTMFRAVRCVVNSHKLLTRSGHSGGNSDLNLYFTDRHIKRGLGIHDSSR